MLGDLVEDTRFVKFDVDCIAVTRTAEDLILGYD
jgi:hypothetical protein